MLYKFEKEKKNHGCIIMMVILYFNGPKYKSTHGNYHKFFKKKNETILFFLNPKLQYLYSHNMMKTSQSPMTFQLFLKCYQGFVYVCLH
jgi:hypothetical protein